MTSSTKPNLLPYFPDEILLHWMSFLPPKDLKNSRLACRRFARAGIEPLLHTLTLTTSTQSRSAFSKVKDDEDARRFVRKVSIVIRLPGVCWPTLAPKRLPVLADIDHFPALKHTALQVEVPMCQDRRSYRLIIKALGLNPSLRQADSPSSMLVLLPLVLTQLTLHCSVNNPGLVTFLPTKWRMPGLKSLTLGNFILGSHGHVDWIVSHKETLKELYLDSCPLVQLVVQSDDTYGGQVSIEENRRFERTFKDITSTSLGDSRNSMRVEPFTKSTAIHLNRSWREMIAHFHEYLPNLEKFGVTQGSWHVGHSSEPLNGRDKQHLLAWRGTSASVSSHCMLRNQRGSRCFHRKATENFLSKNDPMVYVVEEVGTIRSRASAVAYPSTVEEDRTAINDFVKHLARKSANRTQYRSFQGSNFEEPSIWTPVKPERLLRMTYARTHHDIFPYHQDWVQIMSFSELSRNPVERPARASYSCVSFWRPRRAISPNGTAQNHQ
ncbi:uncharacterized protein K460DRAFT_139358 [Cucurbitaria berberidis CBS 394.84]|uniref:F-box domain-containing protein n=1 Tax=Cucurbitaria berberidis CBS 394.84 TaxID=1168544 RepID=A0A9P4L6A0_9PLEO|nr:uncharacterized protein K460DRAFT_139358 [Cucurbitaria berberidis CBS 394.84]KAF1843079.1 hypothetical protein K460DRAFT_139358 [Cucurbitaria berberidis CBS 394.84]